jgi:hypothetical protein
MNSRLYLRLRMLSELAICIGFVIVAVDVELVHVSNYVWVDVPCRLLLVISAIGIFTHVITLHRDAGAAKRGR